MFIALIIFVAAIVWFAIGGLTIGWGNRLKFNWGVESNGDAALGRLVCCVLWPITVMVCIYTMCKRWGNK